MNSSLQIVNTLTQRQAHINTLSHRPYDHWTVQGHFGIPSKKSHHTVEWLYCCVVSRGTGRSTGQTSLVIVLERGGVCQGLDPGSCWPSSHLVSAAANPQEGRLLALPVTTWHGVNQSEVKTQNTVKIPSLPPEEALQTRVGVLFSARFMNR